MSPTFGTFNTQQGYQNFLDTAAGSEGGVSAFLMLDNADCNYTTFRGTACLHFQSGLASRCEKYGLNTGIGNAHASLFSKFA